MVGHLFDIVFRFVPVRERSSNGEVGKQAAADVEAQGEKWQFSWWDSLEPGRKVEKALKKTEVDDKEEVQGKWMEPRVDSEGNIRLVLGGLEV